MTVLQYPIVQQLQQPLTFNMFTAPGIVDPNTDEMLPEFTPRPATLQMLDAYAFLDDKGKYIPWTPGQIEIIDCILQRSSPDGKKRIEIIATTQYGKSLAVAAALCIRASLKPEKWAIVAGTKEKARIIMEYVIMLSLNNDIIKTQLTAETPLERKRMKSSADRITFKMKGEIRVYSADAGRVSETSKSLMGFGSPNIIEDESALIDDQLQATVMRMLGGSTDNFLIKIGNPFNRGHFHRTWINGQYYRIFIDYNRGLQEGRLTPEYIAEMKEEAMFNVLYGCLFPKEGVIDNKGWLPLLTVTEVENAFVERNQPFGLFKLGNDVAGGGKNYSASILRAYNVAIILYKKNEADTMIFLDTIIKLQLELGVPRDQIFIDKNGIGRGMYNQAKRNNDLVVGVNGGDPADDTYRYENKRAEMFWRLREWILSGHKLEKNDYYKDWYELAKIKYKVNPRGRIVIMSKPEMLAHGIDSPDIADALSLTFAKVDGVITTTQSDNDTREVNDDPY